MTAVAEQEIEGRGGAGIEDQAGRVGRAACGDQCQPAIDTETLGRGIGDPQIAEAGSRLDLLKIEPPEGPGRARERGGDRGTATRPGGSSPSQAASRSSGSAPP